MVRAPYVSAKCLTPQFPLCDIYPAIKIGLKVCKIANKIKYARFSLDILYMDG